MVGTAVLVVAIGLAVIWLKVVRGSENPGSGVETFVARRGPLTVSVLEAGALKAKDPAILRSSTPRRATILSIVPEGIRVQEGDLLVELDVSELIDHLVDHEIMVKNAEAAWINAREHLTIVQSQAQSSVDLARLNHEFAKQDLEKYTGAGGQYQINLAAAQGRIKLAEEEMEKAADYLTWSQRLYEEKYLSKTQFQADRLALEKAKLSVTVAQNDLYLLQEYTYGQQVTRLTSDVNQTARALERAEARARATVAQAQAYLAAREQVHQGQLEWLERHRQEIAGSKIYAPADGMVIYATSGQSDHHEDRVPLADGVEVWERQALIYLQKSTSTIVEVALHEASLQKVRVGLPALVSIDALPGRKIMGTVTRIAPLADSQSMWRNPDLKVYRTEIALHSDDPALRSGMNCKVEIVLEQHEDTMRIPLQTVLWVGGQPIVYVLNADRRIEERAVEIGLDDNHMIQIIRGLGEGERVLLTPAPKTGPAEPRPQRAGTRGTDDHDIMQRIHEKLKATRAVVPAIPHVRADDKSGAEEGQGEGTDQGPGLGPGSSSGQGAERNP
jgi:HlyD family secretion protein